MTTRHLIEKTLEKMKYVNTVIPNLNCGGCGVFAHALASELEHKGLKPKVAVIASNCFRYLEDNFVENLLQSEHELTAKKINDSGADIAHMMVYIEEEDLYIDSEGIYGSLRESSWSNYKHQFNMTVEHTGIIVANASGWNSRFDRKFIPKVYDIVICAVNKAINKIEPQPLQLTLDF
jgi:hypothetical protein